MSSPVQHKRSSVAGKVPLAGDIEIGEVAVNFPDRKIFTKDASNAIVTLSQPEWVYTDEFHVDPVNGIDATSVSGGEGAPWKTITYALSRMASSGQSLVLHDGSYSENVSITKTNIEIRGTTNTGGLVLLTGAWTFAPASSSVRMWSLNWSSAASISITGAGSVYFRNCIASCAIAKSGGGYVQIDEGDFAGTGINITGAGTVLVQQSFINLPVVNNASAVLSVIGSPAAVAPIVTSGVALFTESFIYSTGNTTAAITSAAAGITYVYNSHLVAPNQSTARVSLSGLWSINNTQYDRANSTLTGANLGTVNYFDALQTVGNITVGGVSSLGAVGNVRITGGNSGQVLTTNGSGNLSWSSVTSSLENTIYVAKNGNDSTADGSIIDPYLTITAAMNSIADNSPSKRYSIMIAPGEYSEGATLNLKPNVFLVGQDRNNTRITSAIAMNSTFTGSGDNRSGANNITFTAACNFNWTTVTSAAGKLYFANCSFSSTVTLYGYNNAVAQAQFVNNLFFGAFTVSGINVGVHMNNRHYSTIALNQHPNGGMATILNMSGGDSGAVTVTTTVNDFNRRCSLFAKSFYMGGLTIDGLSSYADVTVDSLPSAGATILNSGNIVYLNDAANTSLSNLKFPTAVNNPIIPAATNATNFGDWGNQWFWSFGYIHASTGTDLYLISYGNSYGADTTGRNIGIYTDGAGLGANVSGGGIVLETSATTGTGNSGNIDLTTGNVVSGVRGNVNITANAVNVNSNLTATGTISAGNISTGSLSVTGTSNLGAVGNVTITGGSNGQVLTTAGNGTLSWANIAGATSISNGTSNVNIAAANGNITMGVGGVANVLVVTTTGANLSGALTATGTITGANFRGAALTNNNSNLSITNNANISITSTAANSNIVISANSVNSPVILSTSGNSSNINFNTNGSNSKITLATFNTFSPISVSTGQSNSNIDFYASGENSKLWFNSVSNNGGMSFSTGGVNSNIGFATTANSSPISSNTSGFQSGITQSTGGILSTIRLRTSNSSSGILLTTTGPDSNVDLTTNGTNSVINMTSNGANAKIIMSVANANVVTITGTGANIDGTLQVGGQSNLGAVGNVTITGGSNGQVLTTNGSGVLSWGNAGNATAIVNGNSNVVVSANGNVTVGIGGTDNVMTVTSTGANITGTANITGNVSGGNLTTAGVVTATGNVSGGNLTTAGVVSATGNVTGGNLTTVGVVSATGNVSGGNLTTAGVVNTGSLSVTGTSNLGAVGNITITGGSNGQVLTTNGGGVLTWANGGGGGSSSISNGTSNVNIATSNGNITMGVSGTGNMVVISNAGITTTGNVYANNYYINNTLASFGVSTPNWNRQILAANTTASGSNVSPTTLFSVAIPGAGTWRIVPVIRAQGSSGYLSAALYIGGSMVANTETMINNFVSNVFVSGTPVWYVTTNTAQTYTVGVWGGLIATSDGNGRSYVSYELMNTPIAVEATATGVVNSDYIQVTLSTNVQYFAGSVWPVTVPFNSVKQTNGGIPFNTSTGVFTLTAGKTYLLEAQLSLMINSQLYNVINYYWVDATTNTALVGGVGGAEQNASEYQNYTASTPIAKLYYTPATNQTVKLRMTYSGPFFDNVQILGQGVYASTYAVIQEINRAFAINGTNLLNTTGNLSVGNLAITGASATSSAATTTHKVPITIGGVTYYMLLSNV